MAKTAVLVVDAQNDFFPGGALPVPEGDAILPAVNRLLARARKRDWPVIASRDWHPADHTSFRSQGGPWPAHCVRGTAGAELHGGLELPPVFTMVHKATQRERDAYSAFDGTGLAGHLHAAGITTLVAVGLALDYCVKASCLDARREGFSVQLLLPGTRAVEVQPGDGDRALAEVRQAGVEVLEEIAG